MNYRLFKAASYGGCLVTVTEAWRGFLRLGPDALRFPDPNEEIAVMADSVKKREKKGKY